MISTIPVTKVSPGDVMLNKSLLLLVDVVAVTDLTVDCINRADYKGSLLSFDLEEFIRDFEWIRSSEILLGCYQDGLITTSNPGDAI